MFSQTAYFEIGLNFVVIIWQLIRLTLTNIIFQLKGYHFYQRKKLQNSDGKKNSGLLKFSRLKKKDKLNIFGLKLSIEIFFFYKIAESFVR